MRRFRASSLTCAMIVLSVSADADALLLGAVALVLAPATAFELKLRSVL